MTLSQIFTRSAPPTAPAADFAPGELVHVKVGGQWRVGRALHIWCGRQLVSYWKVRRHYNGKVEAVEMLAFVEPSQIASRAARKKRS